MTMDSSDSRLNAVSHMMDLVKLGRGPVFSFIMGSTLPAVSNGIAVHSSVGDAQDRYDRLFLPTGWRIPAKSEVEYFAIFDRNAPDWKRPVKELAFGSDRVVARSTWDDVWADWSANSATQRFRWMPDPDTGDPVQDMFTLQTYFSDLQQDIKSQAMLFGYPDRVTEASRPLVEFYTETWIPLIRGWQKFYADNKSWSGSGPWAKRREFDEYVKKLDDMRDRVSGISAMIEDEMQMQKFRPISASLRRPPMPWDAVPHASPKDPAPPLFRRPLVHLDEERAQYLSRVAAAHGELPFRDLATAALGGEEWARERMQGAVMRWMSGQASLQVQGLPLSDDLVLKVAIDAIRATDVSRPPMSHVRTPQPRAPR